MKAIDQAITAFDKQFQEKGMRSQRSYPNEFLIQFIASNFFKFSADDRKKIRILEIGCGSGANLWMLAKEGFEVYGLDSSQTGIDLATRHLEDKWGVRAVLSQGSFTKLPYEDEYFDAVVDVVSLQHLTVEDCHQALDEVSRVLKKGGVFFSYRLSDHSIMFEHSGGSKIDAATVSNIEADSMPLANNGPTSFWSPALAYGEYTKSSLRIDSIETVGRTYSTGAYVEYLAISSAKV